MTLIGPVADDPSWQARTGTGFDTSQFGDEPALVAWLCERVTSPTPAAEALKMAAYGYMRSQQLEPPAMERLRRLLRTAVGQREQRLVT